MKSTTDYNDLRADMNVLIANNIASVRKRIIEACSDSKRDPAGVNLLAVSKTKSADEITQAVLSGLTNFGENYLQEAEAKIDRLADLHLTWHFIGRIQANKTKILAEKFDWIHSLSSLTHARRLHNQRPESLDPLNIMLQVNVSRDPDKAGIAPGALFEHLQGLMELGRLRLCGLMTLPVASHNYAQQCIPFAQLKELLQETRIRYGDELPFFNHLSMGMSRDLEAAIAQGASWVRIGTDIFGPRQQSLTSESEIYPLDE